jgi:hypothetical protein
MFNGRRQSSRGGTSRMTRECQVRFCERLGVKFPGPTRHFRPSWSGLNAHSGLLCLHSDRIYPHKPLVSYRINRQLFGWIPPPLMIRAFGAHCQLRTRAVQ